MNNQDFDRLLNSIREDVPGTETTEAAAQRVREHLAVSPVPEGCAHSSVRLRCVSGGNAAGWPPDAARRSSAFVRALPPRVFRRRRIGGCDASANVRPRFVATGWAAAAAVVIGGIGLAGYAFSPRIDRAFAASGPRGTVASVNGTLVTGFRIHYGCTGRWSRHRRRAGNPHRQGIARGDPCCATDRASRWTSAAICN